ncbi:5'-methylthioadenosine nucleosidase [Alphaproteobacteria bacterium]|nr:5'-methylthioadenosine nucleosidase [Alphaproteobacteria bacterium]
MIIFIAALKEEIQNMEFFYLSGVGKINAAFKSLDLIHRFNPTQIINYGTAGSINKKCQGLIECTKFYQRDMDARGLMNFNLGETPFDDVNEIITDNYGYSCGTGDNFVKNEIEMNVDVVDMEAYAIAKICKLKKVKFRCFKYITDNANENSAKDWIENCQNGAKEFYELHKKLSS